ncbi:MAG: hypothetical protein HY722_05850, partial [Planctomycetes bacterium]|nr:hypothetical protein [Planctomycetota bacterium]
AGAGAVGTIATGAGAGTFPPGSPPMPSEEEEGEAPEGARRRREEIDDIREEIRSAEAVSSAGVPTAPPVEPAAARPAGAGDVAAAPVVPLAAWPGGPAGAGAEAPPSPAGAPTGAQRTADAGRRRAEGSAADLLAASSVRPGAPGRKEGESVAGLLGAGIERAGAPILPVLPPIPRLAPSLKDARWSAREARPGEGVTLHAKARRIPEGTEAVFRILRKGTRGEADTPVAELKAATTQKEVLAQWVVESPSPSHLVFVVRAAGKEATSDTLQVR